LIYGNAILSQHKMTSPEDRQLSQTGRFSVAWHAQVYALSIALFEANIFVWSEFSEMLGKTLAETPQDKTVCDDDHYYQCYLEALASLLTDKHHLENQQCNEMIARWRAAYLNTAHGKPVKI